MNILEISVVIPIKNDVVNLENLLENLNSLGFSDIHVVDSVINNLSVGLCERYSVNYVCFNWNGSFPKKRNWALENLCLRPWVFFIDSDERLTKEILREIEELDLTNKSAVSFRYNNTFLGKKLRFGDVMTKIPLIKNSLRFERIEENQWSQLDMEVHEHPVVDNKALLHAKNRIEHFECLSIEKYLNKHNDYSTWESRRLSTMGKVQFASPRTRTKYVLLSSPWVGLIYFCFAYVLKMGFLDGRSGYHLAKMKSQYFYWIYLKNKYEVKR